MIPRRGRPHGPVQAVRPVRPLHRPADGAGGPGSGDRLLRAPGLVLTCAHVVEAAWPDKAVDVHWAGRTIPGQIEGEHYRPKPGPDLALLRVELVDHPCVFLHESFTLDDKLLKEQSRNKFPIS